MVGTSGRIEGRVLLLTASARSLPACTFDRYRLQRIEHDLDLAAQQVGHGGRTALVRHVLDIDPRPPT